MKDKMNLSINSFWQTDNSGRSFRINFADSPINLSYDAEKIPK